MKLERLISIVRKLRGPSGCPWDRRQTHRSIKPCLLEETHEVLEAIDQKDAGALKDELGDLLLQIVFHAEIERERGNFSMSDVIDGVCDKLVRRHPHVFKSKNRIGVPKVLRQWEMIKRGETGRRSGPASVPRALPALLRAARMQEKASRLGFEWRRFSQALAKLEEELREFRSALKKRSRAEIRHELGDALFALAKVARFLKMNPEEVLQAANSRFLRRFSKMERAAAKSGRSLHEVPPAELYALWRRLGRR